MVEREQQVNLRRRCTGVMLGVALLGGATPGALHSQLPSTTPTATTSMQQDLDAWFRRASQRAPGSWGIVVATQDGQLVWATNPTTPLIPASTVKVFTTGFARTVVGPDARRATRVVGSGDIDPTTGLWRGAWALEVNGDFTLDRPGKTGPTLMELAQRLAATGVRRLSGPLAVVSEVGDPKPAFPAAWSSRHRGRTFAPLVGSLTINENLISLQVRPGAAAGRRPTLSGESPLGVGWLVTNQATTVAGRTSRLSLRPAANGRWTLTGSIGTRAGVRTLTAVSPSPESLLEASWRHALLEAGIEWEPSPALVAPAPSLPARRVLAEVTSQPFDSIAAEVNSRSSNLGAELLLRWAAGGDAEAAAARLNEHVRSVTGDPRGVALVDGSGLSEQDRASAWTFVAYLARFPYLAGGRDFPALLPANGEGTLKSLATGLPAPGVVRAKTGTLGNVASVTGYLGRRDGVLVISMLYNGSRPSVAREEQWRLFRLLGADGVQIPTGGAEVIGAQLGDDPATTPLRLPPTQ